MIVVCVQFLFILYVYVVVASAPGDYGEWGNWGEWSRCSVTCGYGSVRRNKNWIYKNGQVSNYTYSMIAECWTEIPCPVNGGWTMWTAWSECSKMCGGGIIAHTRLCLEPEPYANGRPCEGSDREERPCNVVKCPDLPYNFDMSLCNETTFICKSKLQCIPEVYHCDNKLHCHDGSDEQRGDCIKYNSLNSNGSQTNTLLNIIIILMAVILVIVTTNHPV